MPFVSKKQQAWGHTKEGIKALGGKKNVEEWIIVHYSRSSNDLA